MKKCLSILIACIAFSCSGDDKIFNITEFNFNGVQIKFKQITLMKSVNISEYGKNIYNEALNEIHTESVTCNESDKIASRLSLILGDKYTVNLEYQKICLAYLCFLFAALESGDEVAESAICSISEAPINKLRNEDLDKIEINGNKLTKEKFSTFKNELHENLETSESGKEIEMFISLINSHFPTISAHVEDDVPVVDFGMVESRKDRDSEHRDRRFGKIAVKEKLEESTNRDEISESTPLSFGADSSDGDD